jgi:hypothetical protein
MSRTVAVCGLALALTFAPSVFAAAQSPQRERPVAAPVRPNARYTLTPTQNIWTSLLLDSSTGRIWQVHFALNDSSFAGRLAINEEALVQPAEAHVGRFALQETQNIFTFLLLDQDDGRIWHVQWSNGADKRGILRQL